MITPTEKMRDAVRVANRRIMMLKGEEEALRVRKATLEQEVGLAKGRISLKPKIELFLEELQMEGHAKRVGDFEKLLTALVSEVLPGRPPIGLDLEIKRGAPELDIVSRISADYSEDIFEDQGGAITNIIVLGLRLIAIVRSGMRKFVILDESDCWVETDRIPMFYSIVKEVSRKIGVQCFAISHHAGTSFGEGISIARLTGDPEYATGVEVTNNPRPYRWTDDEDGLRYVRLQNVQGYINETIHLNPGVNALVGTNNIGKSTFVRAFRAVFYAEVKNKIIRRGEKQCVIEVGLPLGRTLQFSRQPGRNPVNLWKLLGTDGAVITENGTTYEEGGTQVPAWVAKVSGIGLLDGLDVQLIKQKLPIFLLDKPGSVRAAVLSIGQETAYIKTMIAEYKSQCTTDNARIRDGETEMNTLLNRIEKLSVLENIEASLGSADALIADVGSRNETNRGFEAVVAKLVDANSQWKKAKATADALGSLPEASDVKRLTATVERSAKIERAGEAIFSANRAVERSHAVRISLARLPGQMPTQVNNDQLLKVVEDLIRSRTALSRGEKISGALAGLRTMPEIRRSDDIIRAGKAIKDGRIKINALSARHQALSRLPSTLPTLSDSKHKTASLTEIETARARLVAATQAKERTLVEFDGCEKELGDLVDAMGHTCPLCNGQIDDPSVFMSGHSHVRDGANV